MRASLTGYILLFSVYCLAQSGAGLPFITNFSPAEYKQGAQNFAVLQDKQGLLYFGNNKGVLVYDGSQWSLIQVANKTEVHSLAQSDDSTLYVGAQGDFGYLEKTTQNNWQFRSLLLLVDSAYHDFNDVWSIHLTPSSIVFRSTRYLFIYKNDEKSVKTIPLRSTLHRSFLVGNEVWVRQGGVGLQKLVNDSLIFVAGGEQFKDESINAVLPYPDGKLLLTSEQRGLLIFSEGKIQTLPSVINKTIVGQSVYGKELSDGTYALATRQNGLLIIRADGSVKNWLRRSEGIPDESVWAVQVDRFTENIWLATNNGICVVELESPFTLFGNKSGLGGQFYSFKQFKNSYYAAGSLGVFTLPLKSGAASSGNEQFTLIPELKGQSWFLHADADSNALLVTTNDGVFEIREGKAKNVGYEDRSWMLVSLKKFPGFLLGNTVGGVQLFKKTNTGYVLYKKLSQRLESLYYFAEDPQGNVWVNSPIKGIYRFHFPADIDTEPEITLFTTKHGLPSTDLIRPFAITNDLLFGTENGIYRFNTTSQRFEADTILNKQIWGNASVTVELLQDDFQGNLWGYYKLNNNAGFSIGFKLEKVGTDTSRVSHDVFRRIRSLRINGITFTDANTLFLTTPDGVISMNVTKRVGRPFTVLLRESKALSGDSSFHISSEASLPYSFNHIHFRFAAMGFDGKDAMEYSYRLEGFDHKWSDYSTLNQKEYTNLPAGTYTFRVKAKNHWNTESEETFFTLTIVEPWYQTLWAFLLYGLLVITLVIFFNRWRSNSLRDSNRRLEENIRERISEIRNQSDLILEKNRELESQKEEIESQKEDLVEAQKMIEQKNQHLGYINQHLEQIVESRTEQLQTAYTNLLNLKNELDTFIYRSSHDIKGPLMRLLGLTYVAKADVADPTAIHYFNLLEKEINVTNRMLQKLIVYQQIKNTIPSVEAVNITNLIQQQLENLKTIPAFSLFKINIDKGTNLTFATNSYLLGIVVHNILENCFLYNDLTKPVISIEAELTDENLVLYISDNGKGIDEAIKGKIFDMFYRGSELSKGAGLGLYIAQEAMRKLNGNLTQVAHESWQTTFRIALPVHTDNH